MADWEDDLLALAEDPVAPQPEKKKRKKKKQQQEEVEQQKRECVNCARVCRGRAWHRNAHRASHP